MLSPLPNLVATITWTARCCGQDRRKEAHRKSGSGLKLAPPCSRWLRLGPCICYASATARIYIRGAGLGHAGLGLGLVRPGPDPFAWPGFDQNPSTRAAIINGLGAA